MEDIELFVLRVPVGTDALEDAGPVVERVRQDAHLGVPNGDELAIEEGKCGIWGGAPSQRRRSGQLLHHAHTPCPAMRPTELWTGPTHAPCGPASAIVTGLLAVRPPVCPLTHSGPYLAPAGPCHRQGPV